MSKLQSSKAAATADFQYDFIFLRSAPADGVTARKHIEGGFAWPTGPDAVGRVIEAPDWDPSPSRDCGGGLHGLPSGIGDWGLVLSPSDMSVLWYVCGASMEEAVFGSGKVRVRRCRILYVGHFGRAMDLISPAMTAAVADLAARRVTTAGESAASNSGYSGAASNSGYSGAASNSGYRGAASNSGDSGAASNSGDRGAASNSGDRGAASNSGDSGAASNSGDSGAASNSGYSGAASNSGYRGAASNSGYRGAASNSGDSGAASNSGDSGAASNSGDSGAASNSGYSGAASSVGRDGVALAAGIASRGMVSNGSLLVLIERDENGKMLSYFAAREGERGIQAGHWYTLRAGYPVEVDALGEELVQKSSTL